MIDLSVLNAEQKEAVSADDKYLRIVAGAGSGKTRVLTTRIACLIDEDGILPYRILAITFTNKAASEMKRRIRGLLPGLASEPWISTIHSLCARILRHDIENTGRPADFTIMDTDDQKTIFREACRFLKTDHKDIPARTLSEYISAHKTAGISPQEASALAGDWGIEKKKARIYEYYCQRQREMNALDFDDLIIETIGMFKDFPEIKERWQNRFDYILVDEFQDIDRLQYELIKDLAGKDNAVCVVGDPDQTIYTWRGADVDIIMNFPDDFPGARTIILKQNYRSIAAILNCANALIQNNINRVQKDLFATRTEEDNHIVHYRAKDNDEEAMWIARRIQKLHESGEAYGQTAVLYRANYLSRAIEKQLRAALIPYRIYGGVKFYERMEVKDSLCYLRMVTSADDLAFDRIINTPRRGFGDKTVDRIKAKAREENMTMYETVARYTDDMFSGSIQNKLHEFIAMTEGWRRKYHDDKIPVYRLLEAVLEEIGYKEHLVSRYNMIEAETRWQNIRELTGEIRRYFTDNPEASLAEYLQETSLYTDADGQTDDTDDVVQLMTVHAAKGLEFDTVFVADLNDGIFPSDKAIIGNPKGLEEERRLAYVAFTRARDRLFLTEAGGYSYVMQGELSSSRFIDEIASASIDHIGKTKKKEKRFVFDKPFDAEIDRQIKKEVRSSESYRKGEAVVHNKFGEGIVISCKDNVAVIAFSYPHGLKKIAADHPSLRHKEQEV